MFKRNKRIKEGNTLINVQVDEKTVQAMLEKEIKAKVEELSHERYFLTMKQLSDYVNLSIPVIKDRLIMNGCPHYRQGQKYLFRKQDVDQFLDYMVNSLTGTNDIKFFNNLKRGEKDG